MHPRGWKRVHPIFLSTWIFNKRCAPAFSICERYSHQRRTSIYARAFSMHVPKGTLGGPWLARNRTDLAHLRQHVDNAPGLCNATVSETEDEDLLVRDTFPARRHAHVLTVVRSHNGIPVDNLVILRDQVLDRDVKVRISPMERQEHELERLRAADVERHGRADRRVGFHEL